MNAFEEMLFAGLSSSQYNILWVEHNDKIRLELNFVVPRMELSSGNDLDLYSHRRDLPLCDMWKNGINAKYKLADPNDPRRARTISERTKKARGFGSIVANRKTLDETLYKLVLTGQINNREHMLELLKYSGYEITRKSSENISVKHEDIGKKALRLKGGIYSENFTSIRSIESISKERERQIREYDNKVARGDIKAPRRTYQKYLQTRIDRHQKRYPKLEQVSKSELQDVEKRNNKNMVATIDNENKRKGIDDRIRNTVKTGDRKREECIKRFRERENQILEQIKEYNIQLSRDNKNAKQKLSDINAATRKDVEANIDRDGKEINTKTINGDKQGRNNTDRIYDLHARVNEEFSKLKKTIKGVINKIKMLKLFGVAKNDMSSDGPTKKFNLRR